MKEKINLYNIIIMGSTSNLELENIARFYNLPLIAVCQKDLLKTYNYVNNGFYIINSQSSTEGSGTHWCCLYLNKNISFYFDSYGASPNKAVLDYVKKYSKSLKCNNLIVQSLKSDNCGYYALCFMLFMFRNKNNYSHFISLFDPDEERRNDLIIEGIFRAYILSNKRPPKELSRLFNLIYKK